MGYALEDVLGNQNNSDDEDYTEPIYGDLEVEDFNTLWRNQNYILEKFGNSLSIKLQASKDGGITRTVNEDLSKVRL